MARRPTTPLRFTRKEFYDLSSACHTYALELAHFDQDRVNLKEVYRFNDWLAGLKRYDALGPKLAAVTGGRPVSRWQIIILLGVAWALLALILPGRVDRMLILGLLSGITCTVIALFMLPESLYGATVEVLEGKVLHVVDILLEMLEQGEMNFSEAAFYQARDHLLAARAELRQQIDLAHRP